MKVVVWVLRRSGLVEGASFSDRFTALLTAWEHQTGQHLGNQDIVELLDDVGCKLSATYVSQLRNGHRQHPSSRVVQTLATVFGVTAAYFYHPDRPDETRSDTAICAELADQRLRQLLRIAVDLSLRSQQLLVDMADRLRRAEGCLDNTEW
ncbi:helix-turn-helix transcriptional regulator [Nocardia cyriacigeorgica]|nr:helix-turn-helix transcriptional regulator [Nocardia cyriacigeorgica]MBF6552627.1 helix-turn-helix transcriptional regulator [Nocardia cyriacigeorgica]